MRDDSILSRPLSQPQSHSLAMTNARPGRTPPRGFTSTPFRNGPLTGASKYKVLVEFWI
jgi:hypothetical protein